MRLQFSRAARPGFISVVIPVYRDAAGLGATLRSLRSQSLPPAEFEVIVCNDGADPALSKLCSNHGVEEVAISPNRGSYHARNRGIERSRGEYLAFVDADITVPDRWLEVGRALLEQADYVGGPVIVDCKAARTPADYYEVLRGFRGNREENPRGFYVTANLFVGRRVFEAVGGFDDRLRSGGDKEFGHRALATGQFKSCFESELAVLHPPRGYRKLIDKRTRVRHGTQMLNYLHPTRYGFNRPSLWRQVLNVLAPPRPGGARWLHEQVPRFGILRWYLFLWRFKLESGLRLLPVYRRAHRQAEAYVSQPDAGDLE